MAKRISYNEEAQQFDEQKVRISDNFVQAYKARELRVEDDPFYKLGEGLKDLSKGLKMMHEAGQEDRDVEAQAAALEFSKQEQPYKDKVNADLAKYNETGDLSGRDVEFYKFHARQQAVQFSRAYQLELDRQLIAAGNNPDTDLAAIQEQAYNTVVGAYPSSTTENMWFRSIQGDAVGKINATWEGEVSKAHTKKMFNENVEAWTEDQQDALLEWSEGGGEGDLVAALNAHSGAFYESDSEAIQLQPDQMGDIQVAAITEFAKNNANMGDVDDVQELLTAVQSDSFKLNGLGKARKEELIQNLEQQLIQAEKVQDTRSTVNRSEVLKAAGDAVFTYLHSGGENGAPITEANRDEFIAYLEQELQGYPPEIVEQIKYRTFHDLQTKMNESDNAAYSRSERDVKASNEISARYLTEIRNRIANGASQAEINTLISGIEGLTPEHISELINQSGLYLNTEKIAKDFYRDSGKRILGETVAGAYLAQLDSQIVIADADFGMNDSRYTAAVMRRTKFLSDVNQITLEVVRDWSAISEGGVPMIGDFAAIAGLVDARLTARFEAERASQPVAKTDSMQTSIDAVRSGEATLAQKAEVERNEDFIRETDEGAKEIQMVGRSIYSQSPMDRYATKPDWGETDFSQRTEIIRKATEAFNVDPENINSDAYKNATEDYIEDRDRYLKDLEASGSHFHNRDRENSSQLQSLQAQRAGKAFRKYGGQIEDGKFVRRGVTLDEIKNREFIIDGETIPMANNQYIHPRFNPVFDSYDEAINATDEQLTEIFNALDQKVQQNLRNAAEIAKETPEAIIRDLQARLLEQELFMRDLPSNEN